MNPDRRVRRRGAAGPRELSVRLVRHRVLVGAVLLPALLGTLVLWVVGERVESVDAVPAAVVNLDEPVRTGTGQDRQTVAAGRLLAAGLTSPSPSPSGEEETLAWRLTTPEDAEEGLGDGSYYAVITIPKDFSETVAGISGDDPETARITVRSNDSASTLVAAVSEQVGEVAATRLNQQITATFLEGMYTETGALKTSLGEAESGAGRLADGVDRVGAGSLQLEAGAGELAGGLDRLSSGAGRLADGSDRLEAGAEGLAVGSDRLAGGADELAGGMGRLAAGLGRLHQRVRPLPDRTRSLADGAGQVEEGVRGWSQVLLAWRRACQSDPVLAGSHARLCAATLQAVGVDGGNAAAMVSGSRRLSDGTDQLAEGTPELVSAVGRSADGAQRAASGTRRLASGLDEASAGAARLAVGASRLSRGASDLASGSIRARDGADRLAAGSTRVATGTHRLGEGSRKLAEGLARGAEAIPAYSPRERRETAETVAEPVVSDARRVDPVASAATELAPGVLALALWLGAFVTYLIRRALPEEVLAAASTPLRAALAGWRPAALVGLAQSLVLLGAVALLDVAVGSWVGLALLLVLAAAVFAALNQAFVALLGTRRGWMLSIVSAVLQAVAVEGVVPLDGAPGPVLAASEVLPVPLVAEGVGAVVLGGGPGPVVGAVVGLAVWAAVALGVTALAARRRQRVTLADLRRSVSVGAG